MKNDETVQMRFSRDMYYTDPNVPLYRAGEICDVPRSMVFRWAKRGGEIIDANAMAAISQVEAQATHVAPQVEAVPEPIQKKEPIREIRRRSR